MKEEGRKTKIEMDSWSSGECEDIGSEELMASHKGSDARGWDSQRIVMLENVAVLCVPKILVSLLQYF